MIVGGLTLPPGLIVKVAGTRALTAAGLVFADAVAWVRVAVVFAPVVSVPVVSVPDVWPVAVSGAMVSEVLDVDEVEVDFPPPQPAANRAAKRTASVLTFAG